VLASTGKRRPLCRLQMCSQRSRRRSQGTWRTCVGHRGRRSESRRRWNRWSHPSLHRPAAHRRNRRCRPAARCRWALRCVLASTGKRRPLCRLQMCSQRSRRRSQGTRRTCVGHRGRRSESRLQARRAASSKAGRRPRRCGTFGEQIYRPHLLCHARSTAPKVAHLPVHRGELLSIDPSL